MVITLEPELEAALNDVALRRGSRRVACPRRARQRFLRSHLAVVPDDEWEQRLLGMTRECGVSLPDTALSRQSLYE